MNDETKIKDQKLNDLRNENENINKKLNKIEKDNNNLKNRYESNLKYINDLKEKLNKLNKDYFQFILTNLFWIFYIR